MGGFDVMVSHHYASSRCAGRAKRGSRTAATVLATSLLLAACDQAPQCSGTLITVPEDAGVGFSIPNLMAHASALGMTQQEAETLIYLEGLAPQATLQPGETICLDGRPDT